jgi:alkanesulfonate monooxygenase SsuD/methylene tetrahydromethanopterin reductase-like flavin-dependent oxidoreductase (luciferase family)
MASVVSTLPPIVDTDIVLNPIDLTSATLLDAARAAEDAGFAGVWTYDHLSGAVLHGRRTLDVWTMLGALAAVTTRVALGPLVANATVRHPAHINSAVATLQELSGGRVRLGVGAGAGPGSPFARELTMLGLDVHRAPTRRRMVADTVGYLHALWSGAPEFVGAAVDFRDVEGVLIPDPAPPIIVGANGPRMAALAGDYADGVNVHEFTPDAPGLLKIARDAAIAAGHPSFLLTVEAPFTDPWFDPDSDERGQLEALGVSRVMLRWSGELGVPAIARAGSLL